MKEVKYSIVTIFIMTAWVLGIGMIYQELFKFGVNLPLPQKDETIVLGFLLFFLLVYTQVKERYEKAEDLNRIILQYFLVVLAMLLMWIIAANPNMLIKTINNIELLLK